MVNSKIYQETWNMYIEERVMLLSHHFFYVFSCPFDRLTIYDGPDILAEKIGKFTIHYLILIKWTNQLQAPTAAKCVTWWCSAPTTSSMSPSKRSRERRRFSTEDFLGFTSSARIMWSLVRAAWLGWTAVWRVHSIFRFHPEYRCGAHSGNWVWPEDPQQEGVQRTCVQS